MYTKNDSNFDVYQSIFRSPGSVCENPRRWHRPGVQNGHLQGVARAQVEHPLRSVPGQERQRHDIDLEPAQGPETAGVRLPRLRAHPRQHDPVAQGYRM